MNINKGILVILAGIFLVLVHTEVTTAARYGESCTIEKYECDRLAGLKCLNSTCDCTDGNRHDFNTLTCVAPAGKECTVFDQGEPIVRCTGNATCHRTATNNDTGIGMCYCDPGFVEDIGFCVGTYETSCTNNAGCDMKSFLTCQSGRCQCQLGSEKQIWDGQKCLSLIGENCGPFGPTTQPCVGNSKCSNSSITCSCDDRIASEDRQRCLGGQNDTCTSDDECSGTFSCIAGDGATTTTTTLKPTTATEAVTDDPTSDLLDPSVNWKYYYDASPHADGRCDCKPNEQYYDSNSKVCIVKAGQSCESNPNCIANSQCNQINHVCECAQGFLQTSDARCLGGLNANCSADPNICNGEAFYSCNKSKGVCECNGGYEHNGQKCVGMVPDSVCNDNSDCDGNRMECAGTKKCTCKAGLVPDQGSPVGERRCVGTYGTGCSSSIPCASFMYLGCGQDGKCTCQDAENMNFESTKCVGFAGSACLGQDGCTGNATCGEEICQCNAGFIPDETKKCKENSAHSIQVLAVLILSCLSVTIKF